MKHILVYILILVSLNSLAQDKARRTYINKYKYLAIKEMKRSGIPASITLAQGLLESGNGKSTLAKKAKNHFGIKCHNDWRGPYIRIDDDKPKEKFRKYNNVEDSYIDHSNFLTRKQRYAFLFKLRSDDYKRWAKGLKKAGYATARDYASRLIKIIEEEKLYKYDKLTDKEYKILLANKNGNNKLDRRVEIVNGKIFLTIQKGDTFHTIGKHFDVSIRKLHVFNDMSNSEHLRIGQKLYLKRKRRKAASGYDYHLVRRGETLHSISQDYGVKLKMLYKFNYLKKGEEPKPGERIYMRGKAPLIY